MVVPVDRDEGEAEPIYEQRRQPVTQRLRGGSRGRPELESHDRDDHGHHSIAERFEAAKPAFDGPGIWSIRLSTTHEQ